MRPALLGLEELFWWGAKAKLLKQLGSAEVDLGFSPFGWQYFQIVWEQLNCRN